jgi:hypothetical protein
LVRLHYRQSCFYVLYWCCIFCYFHFLKLKQRLFSIVFSLTNHYYIYF